MYRTILFLTFFNYSIQEITIKEAFQKAGCLARCKKESCRNSCNESTDFQDLEKIPIAADFNASLHCKDVNFLSISHNPGIFVIEQGINDATWNNPIVDNGRISLFSNLLSGTQYRYRAYRVTKDGVSLPEVSDWFQTTKNDIQPEPIKNISVKNILPENKNSTNLKAEIVFHPAEDRSCLYNVLSWAQEDGLSIFHLNATQDFKFDLHRLNYLENHTIIISARNQGSISSSKNVTFSFITPSCLEVHKNISICPPDSVENFNISHITDLGNQISFIASWSKPNFIPNNYTIQIQPVDESERPNSIIVSGESTEVLCFINKSELLHVISIISESAGGTSLPVSILQSFNNENNLSAVRIELIILPLTAVIITIISIFYFWFKRNIRKNNNQLNYHNNLKRSIKLNPVYEKFLKSTINLDNKVENDPLITKDSFEIKPVQLLIKDVLGSGISGIVRLGSLKVNQSKSIDVAVKMLKDCPTAEEIRNFQQEISIMKSAGIHPNIVSLIGCCTSCQIPMLVVEYCSRGDLQSYLRNILRNIMNDVNHNNHLKSHQIIQENPTYLVSSSWNKVSVSNQMYDIQEEFNNQPERITANDLLNFARQVANGMEFLSLNRIVHRDLAARNVLVCADLTIKISDFGLSRDVYRENVYKKEGNSKLPIKWMAIEALTHQMYTTQSDVWSFGILLYEIVTLGCNPYPEIPTNMILQYLKSGNRMEKPSNCGSQLYDLMNACWRTSPKSRPTFTELKHAIDRLLQTITHNDYINLQNDAFQVPEAKEIGE